MLDCLNIFEQVCIYLDINLQELADLRKMICQHFVNTHKKCTTVHIKQRTLQRMVRRLIIFALSLYNGLDQL